MSRLAQRGSQVFPSVDNSVDDLETGSEDVPLNQVEGSRSPQNEDPDISREDISEIFVDVPINWVHGSTTPQNEDRDSSREDDSENPEDLGEIFQSP